MQRTLKIVGLVVAGIVACLLLVVAGLWWWAGTQGSLDWTLKRIAQSQPMVAEGVTGSLRSGIQAKRLQWHKDGLKIEAFDAQLAWQPLALARATLQLDHLRAQRLRIEDTRPPQPSVVPVSLVLPLRVEIDEVKISTVQWIAATNNFEVADVAGRYSFNTVQHQLRIDSLRWAGGAYSGEASVGAHGNLPVDAKVQGRFETVVPGGKGKLPLTFTASLQGPVTEMNARALLAAPAGSASTPTSATATARVTPWGAQPLPEAHADFRQLDLRALWAQAPHSNLSGQVHVRPAGTGTWALEAEVANATPGPWDQERLPVERLKASGEWRAGGAALVKQLQAKVGGGDVQATGRWHGSDGWSLDGKLTGVDPAALHGAMASLPVSGSAQVKGQASVVDFDVALKGAGAPRPAKAGKPSLAALELREATARGRWSGDTLSLPTLEVRTSDAALRGSFEFQPKAKAGSGRANLIAPSLQARLDGKISETSGAGTLQASSGNLGQALRWLAKVPGAPLAFGNVAAGRGEAQVAWQGGWRDPVVQASVAAPSLEFGGAARTAAASAWTVRDAVATLNGRLSDAALQVRGRAEQGQRRVNLELAGRGGRRSPSPAVWQGQLASFNVAVSDPAMGTGTWTLSLQRPFELRYAGNSFDAGAGQAVLGAPRRSDTPSVLAWEPVRWRSGGELQTAGRLTGLPLAWVELLGGPQLAGSALSGDMVFDGQWDASLGATPRIRASLARSRGDITVLAEAADGAAQRVRAGVREARVEVTSEGDAVTATLRWDSERGGTADGRLATRLSRGADGWQWPDSAPLSGQMRAQLPRIGVWSLLAPPGWRLRGSLGANVAIAGTKADPQMTGTLAADDLALRSVVDGVELQGGRLRAHLEGRKVLIDEFTLRGPGPNGGTLVARGEGNWTAGGPVATMTAEITRLRASIRSDRQLTMSGTVAARRDNSGTVVNGNLRIDQALIVLPEESTPKLGDDVVVRGAAGPITRVEARASTDAQAKAPSQQLKLDVAVDLGSDFRVQGLGIDTRLAGTLALTGQSLANPRLVGTIRASGGEYRAYGQRLDIERGVIRFTGAVDNPALDVLAIRPNMVQKVGVMVTGTALAPYVRLYAEPDMPDVQKLSWLVTGRASGASGAEAALMQQAALALLASRSGSTSKKGIAASLGLDELSFKREGADGPSITLGKRFGRNFYAAYERSLSGALGTLYIFYDLTRRVTVRAEAGERTAVDLIYTLAFD